MPTQTENGSKYAHIAVLEPTKERIDMVCPKAWTYDRFLNELVSIFESEKKSGAKSGKSSENHS